MVNAERTREVRVWAAPAGFPSVEVQYSLAISAVLESRLEMDQLIRLAASKPPGSWAWNPRAQSPSDVMRTSCSLIPKQRPSSALPGSIPRSAAFEGRRLKGRIAATFLRGAVVAQDRDIVLDRPMGRMARYVRRPPSHQQEGLA